MFTLIAVRRPSASLNKKPDKRNLYPFALVKSINLDLLVGLIDQVERMHLSGNFLLAVGAVLANVGLQVQLEVGVQGIHAVATGQRNQRVDREDEVGLEARLGGLLGAIAGRSADDKFVLLLVTEVDDAVPEPWRVHQHIAGAEHRGVALDLVQPGRRLGTTFANQSLGVRGETFRVDRGLQVGGLGDRDEPPLLLTSNLAEAAQLEDDNGNVTFELISVLSIL